MGFKNKKGAAFGTYGWSGESVRMITEELKKANLDVMNEGLKALWNPDEAAIRECRDFGREIGNRLSQEL